MINSCKPQGGARFWLSSWVTTVRTALAVLAGLALAACATGDVRPPEEEVRALSVKRWQLLLSSQLDEAYKLTAPSYRKLRSADDFRNRIRGLPVRWIGAKVLTVQCQDASCIVRTELESKPMIPTHFKGTLSSGIDESWVFEDGRWWILEPL